MEVCQIRLKIRHNYRLYNGGKVVFISEFVIDIRLTKAHEVLGCGKLNIITTIFHFYSMAISVKRLKLN